MMRPPLRLHGVLLCVIWLALSVAAWAQAPALAPVNPDFLRAGTRAALSSPRPLGYVPAPADWSHLTGQRIFRAGRATFPASYDLRSTGRVSPVKNQGSSGCCWAFGTLASLESGLLPGEATDFSENNLKNLHGFAYHPNTGGGNREMATAYVARWSGPVNENDDPFVATSTSSTASLTVRKHVQHVTYIPDRAASTDNANIKQALMTYGVVATTMYWDDAYYRATTYSFFNPSVTSSNHMVAIVGWDDAYPASNFTINPGMNGAFIIKNSWGAAWGNSGYFYISYADRAIGKANSSFYNGEATTNYTRVYQYDTLGQTGSAGYNSPTAWMANVFTATAAEQIKAVGVYALTANTTYQVSGYLNPTDGPLSATAAFTQTGTISEPGYHTIMLTTPMSVTAGQKFSLVMRVTSSGYGYPLPLERPIAGYSSAATASAGQSYMSADGVGWADVTTYYPNSNACLKAFAGVGSGGSTLTAATLAISAASPQPVNTDFTLTAGKIGGTSVEYKFEVMGSAWSILRDYASGTTATWQPAAAGSYTLRVSVRDVDYPAVVVTKTQAFTITPALSAVTVNAAPLAPRPVGTAVTLTAVKTGGANVQYQFSASGDGGSTWSVIRAWSTSVTATWTPATAAGWQVKVAAREGSSGTPVDSAATDYLITPAPPTAVTLAAAVASPQPANSAITLTAGKSGGSTVEYQFDVVAAGGAVTVLRAWGTTASAAWSPAAAGLYTLRVFAREQTLPATVVSATLAYTIVAPLTVVTFNTSLATPQPVAKAIRISAMRTGGGNVQYQFSASSNGGGAWTVLQAWSATATKDWTPTLAGTYHLKVSAREGATGTPVESAATPYVITPTPPTAVTLAASPTTQVVNAAVTLTAVKTGGSTVEFQFDATYNGVTTVVCAWSTTATATWTPSTAGAYTLRVSARESTLPATVVQKTLAFTVTPPLTAVAFTTALATPQPVGKAIRITATKTGGANVQYQFSASSNGGGAWAVLQAWSTTATKDWAPTTIANWQLKVAAREGASGTPVETAATPFVITPMPPTAVTLAATPTIQVVQTAVALTTTKTGGTNVEYQFDTTLSGVTTIIRAWSSTATATWTPAIAGLYSLRVSVRESTLPATVVQKSLSLTVTSPLSAVAFTTTLAAPQPVNKAIRMMATKTGGASVQYQFSASSNGGSTWSVLQAWSTTAMTDWVPTTPGTYQLKVAAREGATGTPVETAATSYLIAPAPPTMVALAFAPVSPQAINTAVLLTATKTGGTTVEYKFTATPAGGAACTVKDWSTATTATWTPATSSIYTLAVYARESALPSTVVQKALSYTVTPVLTAATLNMSLVSPQPVAKSITLTATKTGGAQVQYQFSASSNDGSTWSVLRAWNTTATTAWIPAVVGSYRVKVAAREGSSGSPVESAPAAFTITPAPPTMLKLVATPVSPQPVHTAVALQASSTGGTNVEYQLEVSANNGTTWTVLSPFVSSVLSPAGTVMASLPGSYSWTPTVAGAYKLRLSGREATLPAVVNTTVVSYPVVPALSAVTMTTSLTSPQVVNKSIKLTAAKTGGASVQYQFSVSANGGATWTALNTYGVTSSVYWVPTQAAAYWLKVAAREGNAGTPVESAEKLFTVNAIMAPAPGVGWAFQLQARGDAGNQVVCIGKTAGGPGAAVQATAEDDDANDVRLFIEQSGQPVLQTDLRGGMGAQQWRLVVQRAAARSVTLTWPDLRAVPRGISLTLVDAATGQRCAMRSTSHYVVPASAGDYRLTIEATPTPAAPLRILNLRPEHSRVLGSRVVFTLTAEARVTLTVRGATGRVIRRLAGAQPLPAGEHALVWDGRSEQGTAVPAGAYQFELMATDADGGTVRALLLSATP